MRLLVTGGAGFSGSEFVRQTFAEHPSCTVTVLDKLTYAGNRANLAPVAECPGFEFVHGDICDAELVASLAPASDVIINFAAETHVDRSLQAAGQFVQTDIHGTYVLLEAARAAGHERFVQVSTDEVYGERREGVSHEGDPLRPRNPYAASKAGAEMLIASYRATYGLGVITTRGSNTYGPYQYPEKVVPLFITNAIDGRPLPIYGNGRAVRDHLHVSDHARAINVALHAGARGEDYNVASGSELDIIAVADAVLAAVGRPDSLKGFVEDRVGHDQRYAMATAKMRALGWEPRVAFGDGLPATAAWYVDNEPWWRPQRLGEPPRGT
jgi:dTDP-glucose 4,6-dehydratase